MKLKKIGLFGAAILTVGLLAAGCSTDGDTGKDNGKNTEAITLKIGHVSAKDLPYDLASRGFAKDLEEATDGKVKVEVFEAGQLGGDRDMIEQVQLGTLDMFAGSTASLTNFVPEFSVMDLPFLFEDKEHVYEALDGEIGQSFNEKLESAGFVNLGYWEQGFKNISNSKTAVKSASDMKGIKMRTQESALLTDTYRALGSDPTPIPYPEVYTSIQQGVVQGYEGSYVPFSDVKLYEVQPHLSEVRISFGAAVMLINKETFNKFDKETQDIILDLGKKWALEERKFNAEKENELKELVKSEGVAIVDYDDLDIESFQKAVEPVYKTHNQYAELVEKIRALRK